MNSPLAECKSGLLQVVAFYCFQSLYLEIINSLPNELTSLSLKNNVRGTVLLAKEGVNGTICGSPEGVAILVEKLRSILSRNSLKLRISWTNKQAFRKFKVRLKDEIVTMGKPEVSPKKTVGDYVEPQKWNEFIDDPETLIIDTRNKYEVDIGTFKGSINPNTEIFREFPSWVDEVLEPLLKERPAKRIAMFCTGGIRCEKASSYLKNKGFSDVHHLSGGILRYLEEIPECDSRWEGECFVFDQRVALNHHLETGVHRLCFACGMPLSPEDRSNENYIPGIQCHHCKDKFTNDDRARFADRQKHISELSKRLPGNEIWPSA